MAHPALTRQERRDGIARRAELRWESLTDSQRESLMRKTINTCMDRDGTVTRRDLLQANIDGKYIDRMLRPLLLAVTKERQDAGIRA